MNDPTPLVSAPRSGALKRVTVYETPHSVESPVTHFVTVVDSAPTSGHLQLVPLQHRSLQ